MTTILVLHDDQSVDEFEYDADVRTVTIGRRPSNDVCIQDRSVSGKHAKLTVREDGTWLQDVGSTNGTWLDGDAVDEQRLEDGDEVLIGKVRLKIHTIDPWAEGAGDARAAGTADAATEPSLDDEQSFVERSLTPTEDEDELDESMRRALELYDDDEEQEREAVLETPPIRAREDEDEPDFAEDARLFARPAEPPAREPAHPRRLEPAGAAAGAAGTDDPAPNDRARAALGSGATTGRPRLHAVDSGPAGRRAEHDEPDDAAAPRGPRAIESEPIRGRPAGNGARTPDEARALSDGVQPGRPRRTGEDDDGARPTHELDRPPTRSRGAVIQIKNGAKSGQILPIDKPVTTLGRPGIQIAAIMRKPDGYFLMHIESDDTVERPTLNSDSIGDEPVLLHSGDELNVAGIDVEFMLS